MERILVVGASGNIGVSVITAALRSKYNVLAIVRNQTSAEKIFQHVGTKDGITTVEADVTSDDGVSSVVQQVRAGKLPSFQHVYSTVGLWEAKTPLYNIDMKDFRRNMHVNLEANLLAYRATIPYLLEQRNPNATWTQITGGAGEMGTAGATGISQGALFAMATIGCRENAKTNVRFNEVYLCTRVDYDSVVDEKPNEGRMKASEFGRVYEKILANKQIRGCRVSVIGSEDVDHLKCKKKLTDPGIPAVHDLWKAGEKSLM